MTLQLTFWWVCDPNSNNKDKLYHYRISMTLQLTFWWVCDPNSNNKDKLYHYRISMTPAFNILVSMWPQQ